MWERDDNGEDSGGHIEIRYVIILWKNAGRGNSSDPASFMCTLLNARMEPYYTGYTSDLEKRVKLHKAGKGAKYTRDRRPVNLVWSKEYKQFKPAFKLEKTIKKLTRKQKECLVKGKRVKKVLGEAGIRRKSSGLGTLSLD